jgi:hypothetical protein
VEIWRKQEAYFMEIDKYIYHIHAYSVVYMHFPFMSHALILETSFPCSERPGFVTIENNQNYAQNHWFCSNFAIVQNSE